MTTFLGYTITPIKVSQTIKNDAIVVSTCYFHNDKFLFNNTNYNYIDGLIMNIETFNMKINQFTTNPSRWIYRVYIDEIVLNMISVIENVLGENVSKSKAQIKHKIKNKNKTNSDYINELDQNIKDIKTNLQEHHKIFTFIQLLLTKYIKMMINSSDDKYKNIEIYTYNNENLNYKLYTYPEYKISGSIATSGTLLRYHPLTDSKTSVVIMRNCSHNISPFDIIVQNYWIENTNYEFMEYVDMKYDFERYSYYSKKYLYKLFYNKKIMIELWQV